MEGTHDDAGIIQRVLARDESAFLSLVTRYQRPMRAVALAIVGVPATADEVVQETWLAVLDGLERFEGRSSLKTWIFRILANRARTRAARDGRVVPTADVEDLAPAVDPGRFDAGGHWTRPPRGWGGDPEEIASRAEILAILEKAIALLPPRQRAVVVMRDVEGMSPEEVCALLGMTDGNQRVILHRARAALREAVEIHIGGV